MESVISRPDLAACGYFGRYIGLVEEDLLQALGSGLQTTQNLLTPLTEEQSLHRYAEGKWSIKQVLGHIIDAERIFVYRALCVARCDDTKLPSFDENSYVENAAFDAVPFGSLLEEFTSTRQSTIRFFRHLPSEAFDRTGVAGPNTMSVRAWGFTIAGHETHHRRILEERYLRRQ
jgi:uncharacterized damage-inducible protein DinB